jgi:hypothetical protein
MDVSRNSMLGELASDAAGERNDYVVQATEQLRKFLDRNRDRIAELGGLTLIDEDPDYLSIAPDSTFRVRSRYEDPDTGEWVSDTEVIDNASELVELYNPAEIFSAFAEAAREAAGMAPEPTAADELLSASGIAPEAAYVVGEDAGYAAAADRWAAGRGEVLEADDVESAAAALYNVALDFQERSQQAEASLLEEFEETVAKLAGLLGDVIILDDEDERLLLNSGGRFRGEVLPEDNANEWKELGSPDEIVEFYDPTDIFGDLADTLAEAFPQVVGEGEAAAAAAADGNEDTEDVEDVEDVEDESDDAAPAAGGEGRR